MKKIVFDDSMGAAGDMIAGVLLDLFDNPEEVTEKLNKIIKNAGLEDTVVEFAKEFKDSVDGIEFNVSIDGNEEQVDHWDESDEYDHHHYDHPHEERRFDHHPHWHHDDHRPHDHHYHEHCDQPHDHWDHHPHDHFEHHPHSHFHEDHDHFRRCGHPECKRPRKMGSPFGMPKAFGPSITIEGPIKINFHIDIGKPPKKHRRHHHHHHRRGRSPKNEARSIRKARNRASKKRTLSMNTGKDHLN